MHMKNKSKNMVKNKKYLIMWIRKKPTKNNYNTFTQILSIISHHLQQTQVSWMSTTIIQTTSLTTQNMFASIAAESYVNTMVQIYKKVPPILSMNKYM